MKIKHDDFTPEQQTALDDLRASVNALTEAFTVQDTPYILVSCTVHFCKAIGMGVRDMEEIININKQKAYGEEQLDIQPE